MPGDAVDRHLRGFIDFVAGPAETVISSLSGWVVDDCGEQQWGRLIVTDERVSFYQRRFGEDFLRTIPTESIWQVRSEHRGSSGSIRVTGSQGEVTVYVREDEEVAAAFADVLIVLLEADAEAPCS